MKSTFSTSLDDFSVLCLFVEGNQLQTQDNTGLVFDIPDFKSTLLYQHQGRQLLLIKSDENDLKKGGLCITEIAKHDLKNAIIIPPKSDNLTDFFIGIELGAYRFNHYFSKPSNKAPESVTIFGNTTLESLHNEALAISQGVCFTRDLVSEPSNILTPEAFKDQIVEKLKPLGVEITILDEKEILKRKMFALHGVAKGSRKPPFLVAMHWKGNDEQPLAIVGKGVCFDTGGISIKPSANMHEMKYDMGGAGCVTGLMYTLAKRKAKANVLGIVGLVENMPDGNAQNPGDVVTSMSGQTIEVLNTDAEGRLVLADALTYVQQDFKPKAIIDLATLTGAMVVALGRHYAGIFSNHDEMSAKLYQSGLATNERVWRLPIGSEYNKDIDSDIADMQNIGKGGAGSITAAQFIGRFIENSTPWIHIDIAGVTWAKSPNPYTPKGATGYGVRLLNHLIQNHFE
jgi:leucyl aminopeptidase